MDGAEGEDRFFALAEQDYLRSETKNYVPQLIAAALVAKMPARYGLVVDSTTPLAYDSVHVPSGTSLAAVARASGASSATIKDLNPAILRGVAPPDAAIWVHVPAGTALAAAAQLDSLSVESRAGFRSVKVVGVTTTPTALASREGVTLKQLRWFNPSLKTTRKGRLVAGHVVRVPRTEVLAFARDLPDPSIERYGGASARELTRSGYHVVRRGETLGGIAKRYRMSVARLQSLNALRGTRVIAGQTLRVVSSKKAPVKKSTLKKSTVKKSTVKKATVKKATGAKPAANLQSRTPRPR
jgi:membrane-bound lytic murein transglycosylase D